MATSTKTKKSKAPAADDINNARFKRQDKLLDTGRVRAAIALIVGVGSVGRNVALQLASLGVGKIILCDFDTVDATNISTQGYTRDDMGKLKVDVVAESIKRIDSQIECVPYPHKYNASDKVLNDVDVIFACPDKIEVRSDIFKHKSERVKLIVDGRQLNEVSQVVTWVPGRDAEYETHLFSKGEAFNGGAACSIQGLIYTGTITAGFMLHQMVRWLTDRETEPGTSLTLPAALLVPLEA